MSEGDKYPDPGQGYVLQPWQKINEHIRTLDGALLTIPINHCPEVDLVRTHLIGQIVALKWAAKLWDVE